MVGRGCQQPSIEPVAVGQSVVVTYTEAENGLTRGIGCAIHIAIVNPHHRVFGSFAGVCYRHIAKAVVGVHHVGKSCTVAAHAVYYHSEQPTFATPGIIIDSLKRKEVVGRAAYVGIEDNQWYGFFGMSIGRLVAAA